MDMIVKTLQCKNLTAVQSILLFVWVNSCSMSAYSSYLRHKKEFEFSYYGVKCVTTNLSLSAKNDIVTLKENSFFLQLLRTGQNTNNSNCIICLIPCM